MQFLAYHANSEDAWVRPEIPMEVCATDNGWIDRKIIEISRATPTGYYVILPRPMSQPFAGLFEK